MEERDAEIAAFDRGLLVVEMDGAGVGLDDPVLGVVEADKTAIEDADGIARLALPGVIVFETEILDAHIRSVTGMADARLRQ